MSDGRFSQVDEVELDMGTLMRALGRSLPVLIPLVLVVALGLYFGLGWLTPRYTAETKILIQQGESSITQPTGDTEEVRSLLDAEGVASQVQLIGSRDLAASVVEELGLASLPEFDHPTLAERAQDLLARFGIGSPAATTSTQERVLQRFADALEVYSVDKTRVITVTFASSDPALAARVANAVAERYLRLDREAKRTTNADATRWLESQISNLRTRVASAEAGVEAFRSENGLFMGGQNGNQSLPRQRLDDLNTELARLEAARASADAKAATIRSGLGSGGDIDVPEVLDSQLIQRLREQQVGLRAQIAQLSATLLPNHPRLRELSAQLGDLDVQIRREADRILKSLESEVQTAKAREAEIVGDMQRAQAATSTANDAEVKLRALEREATAQRDLLEGYLRRYREAASRQDGDYLPANARVISRAAVPLEPSFPRKGPITAASSAALLLMLIAFVMLRELTSGRALRPIRGAPPPAATTKPPVARWAEGGHIRRLMPAEPSLAAPAASGEGERLRPLVDRLTELHARRIIVTPAEAASGGRPLAAVALARQLSRRGGRVLLLDLHADGADGEAMAAPGEGLPGFADLFAGEASFAQTIFRDRRSRAHVIPRGKAELPAGFAADERFSVLLGALDHTYEHVLVDADRELASLLAPDAAAVVLVVEASAGEAAREAAVAALAMLGPAEILVLVADDERAAGAEAA